MQRCGMWEMRPPPTAAILCCSQCCSINRCTQSWVQGLDTFLYLKSKFDINILNLGTDFYIALSRFDEALINSSIRNGYYCPTSYPTALVPVQPQVNGSDTHELGVVSKAAPPSLNLC